MSSPMDPRAGHGSAMPPPGSPPTNVGANDPAPLDPMASPVPAEPLDESGERHRLDGAQGFAEESRSRW